VAKSSKKRRQDTVEWIFWGVATAVLAGPCIYLAYEITYERTHAGVKVMMGLVMALVGGSLASWAVNSVLQRRYRKRAMAERKEAKKRK